MITIKRDFIKSKQWSKDAYTVHLYIYLLCNVDEAGQFRSGLKQISENAGMPIYIIKRCLNRLELSNDVTMKTEKSKWLFTLNINNENDKRQNAGSGDDASTIGTKRQGSLPHIFTRW